MAFSREQKIIFLPFYLFTTIITYWIQACFSCWNASSSLWSFLFRSPNMSASQLNLAVIQQLEKALPQCKTFSQWMALGIQLDAYIYIPRLSHSLYRYIGRGEIFIGKKTLIRRITIATL
jgi:hypothetical protein